MNLDEMRELPPKELKSEAEKLESKIWKMRFQARGEPVENSGQLKEFKKDRARMLTIMRQKELELSANAESSEKSSAESDTASESDTATAGSTAANAEK
jgi:large subunit ribosomal protein L29